MKLEMLHPTDINVGLKEEQVKLNKKNIQKEIPTQSYKEIIFHHVFTLFNGVNLFLFILVCLTGSFHNGLFMGVVLFNLGIGIFQSIRSKRMLDQLTILNQKKTKVIRDGKEIELAVEDVVVNDIVVFEIGDQISFDCILVDGLLECNESNLTGESEPVIKHVGDSLLSASFIVAGYAKAQVMRVQEDTYAYSIVQEAKRTKIYPSDLRDSMNKIVKICTIILFPTGILLFIKQILMTDWKTAILSMVAAVIGMIPSGLVLLTSMALAVGSIRLGKKQILIKELYCQETLARVDTLCLDKTGTITEGIMKVCDVETFNGFDLDEVKNVLGRIYGTITASNSTAQAIREYVPCVTCKNEKIVPFSSTRKGLGIQFDEKEAYVCGSYTNLFASIDTQVKEKIDMYASQGYRVITLAKTDVLNDNLQGNHTLMAIICIQDTLKKDIKTTLDYFKEQGVNIKIISGDDASTIAYVTQKAGLNYEVINLDENSDIQSIVENHQAFGRVKPEQKKEIVEQLKQNGHTVAMIGDGVNDILALKEADCAITFKNGSEACQNVASIVLLDNQFENLPSILKQGRNVINNIEKSASLFLVKTLYSVGLSIVTLFLLKNYPFIPVQLTLVSALTVGIPGFILSLEPNDERVQGKFIKKVFAKAVPGAFCVVLTVLACDFMTGYMAFTSQQLSTICLYLTAWTSFCVLCSICYPFTKIRYVLVTCMLCIYIGAVVFFPKVFNVVSLNMSQFIYVGVNALLIIVSLFIIQKFILKKVVNKL